MFTETRSPCCFLLYNHTRSENTGFIIGHIYTRVEPPNDPRTTREVVSASTSKQRAGPLYSDEALELGVNPAPPGALPDFGRPPAAPPEGDLGDLGEPLAPPGKPPPTPRALACERCLRCGERGGAYLVLCRLCRLCLCPLTRRPCPCPLAAGPRPRRPRSPRYRASQTQARSRRTRR